MSRIILFQASAHKKNLLWGKTINLTVTISRVFGKPFLMNICLPLQETFILRLAGV